MDDRTGWPLHEEIQAARQRLAEGETEQEKMAALREVWRLCRERNALMADMDVLKVAGEALVI